LKIYVTNSWCKVDLEGVPVPEELVKALSYVDKQQSFKTFRYTGRYTPSVRSLYNKRSNIFPTGVLDKVLFQFPDAAIVDLRKPPSIDWQPVPDSVKNYGAGHQEAALLAMRENPRGTIAGITAMGKTYVEAGFGATFDKSVLILSHRKEIFDSIVQRCSDLIGEEIGVINANRVRPRRVTVAMVGSLFSKVDKLKDFITSVSAVLVDESHHCSTRSQYFKLIQACENAYYRYGFTATPFRESGDSISVFAATGPVIYSYQYDKAVEDGVVAPLDIYLVPIDTAIKLPILYEFKDVYDIGVVKNDSRNRKIAKIIRHLYDKGENVLVLVWRLSHGQRISNLLGGIEHRFIHGDHPERESAKEEFESGSLPVLIASAIYDEGVSIERIQNVIIAAGMKSERLLVQRTGRGMRTFKGKEKCRIFDFIDTSHEMLAKHSQSRIRFYKRQYKIKPRHLQVDE